jgi:hypothetical protein
MYECEEGPIGGATLEFTAHGAPRVSRPVRRPLGPDNLVTLHEIRAELRIGKERARSLVASLRVCQLGKAKLYRWREVVALAFDEPEAAQGGDAPPAPRYAGPRAKL